MNQYEDSQWFADGLAEAKAYHKELQQKISNNKNKVSADLKRSFETFVKDFDNLEQLYRKQGLTDKVQDIADQIAMRSEKIFPALAKI